MKKHIKIVGFIILAYGIYFHLLPVFNIIKDTLGNSALLKNSLDILGWNFFELFIFLFCGLGIFRLNKVARLIWMGYSTFVLLTNIPKMQMLLQGNFLTFKDAPLTYWVKIYCLFFIAAYSLIFLNLPPIKSLFKVKTA